MVDQVKTLYHCQKHVRYAATLFVFSCVIAALSLNHGSSLRQLNLAGHLLMGAKRVLSDHQHSYIYTR